MRRTDAVPLGAGALAALALVATGCARTAPAVAPAVEEDAVQVVRETPPVPGAAPELTLPEAQRFTLGNGLDVILVERHELPVVDARLVVRTGAAADSPALAGRMTLLADMLDEGTTSRSALEIADALDFLGAELSTSAGWDASVLDLHVLRPRLEPALEIMADVLLRPAFPEDELSRKRDERLARLIQQLDEPSFLASNAFAAVLYGPDHPFGVSTLGTRSTVPALGADVLRAAYDDFYRPNNAFLVVVGDVRVAELQPMLEDAFGEWRPGSVPDVDVPAAPDGGRTAVYIVDKPGAAQSEIRIGHVGVARDTPDYFPLLVMNTVLGGSFTSRLNMNLRQTHGWTYGAGSSFDQRRAPGPFVASAAVHTGVTDSAVVEFVREMRRIRDEPVPDAELERARNYVAYGLARRFETTSDVALRLAEAELYGLGSDFYDRYVASVRAVDADDVARVAREHLRPDRWAIVIAGDRAEIEADLRALGLGDIVVRELEEAGS